MTDPVQVDVPKGETKVEIDVSFRDKVLLGAKTEWQHFIQSKTVKAIAAMELIAVSAFIEQIATGQVQLTFESLKGWAIVQGALIFVTLKRHTDAGIEAKTEGNIDPKVVKAMEAAATEKVVAMLPPEVQTQVKVELAKQA